MADPHWSLPGITGRTRLCGILGHPLDHTLSPRMHNAAFAALGLDWVYLPWPVAPERLGEALGGLRAVGAVNTIVREGDRLAGHTTDGVGLLAALTEGVGFHPPGTCVLILGAGGAGRSAAFALARAGARQIAILNRSAERAQALVADLRRSGMTVALTAY